MILSNFELRRVTAERLARLGLRPFPLATSAVDLRDVDRLADGRPVNAMIDPPPAGDGLAPTSGLWSPYERANVAIWCGDDFSAITTTPQEAAELPPTPMRWGDGRTETRVYAGTVTSNLDIPRRKWVLAPPSIVAGGRELRWLEPFETWSQGPAPVEVSTEQLHSDLTAFVAARCVVGDAYTCAKDRFIDEFQRSAHVAPAGTVILRELYRLFPGVGQSRPRVDGERVQAIAGIGMIKVAEPEPAELEAEGVTL